MEDRAVITRTPRAPSQSREDFLRELEEEHVNAWARATKDPNFIQKNQDLLPWYKEYKKAKSEGRNVEIERGVGIHNDAEARNQCEQELRRLLRDADKG